MVKGVYRRVARGAAWKSLFVLAAVAAACCSFPPTFQTKRIGPFLIYYGVFPDTRAGARRAAQEMRGYPLVVLGQAVRRPTLAAGLVAEMPDTRFFGYADVRSVTMDHVLGRLSTLRDLHLQGVLLDEVGYGLSANSANLQRIVDAAHRDHLSLILNAWDPRSVLGIHLAPGDGVLCENWVYGDGLWRTRRSSQVYGSLRQLQRQGVVVYMDATLAKSPFLAGDAAEPVNETVLYEFGDYIAVSGPNYSAQTDAVFPAKQLASLIGGISF